MSQIIFQYKIVKIRKPHSCYGCRKKFDPGTEMTYSAGKVDGLFSSTYMCANCEEATKGFTGEDWESVMPGEIGHWQGEAYFINH